MVAVAARAGICKKTESGSSIDRESGLSHDRKKTAQAAICGVLYGAGRGVSGGLRGIDVYAGAAGRCRQHARRGRARDVCDAAITSLCISMASGIWKKPPLPYWLVAFSYRVFGVNEFSTRLPMVLSVMLLGMLAFCWGRRAFGERTGIYAGLFVYTCAGVYLFTRVLIPDVLLSLLIAASLYFFLTALEPEGAAWRWYAGYALMALGVLTKGLIALVFPGGAAFFFLLVTGEWRRWREFRLFSGLALFLAIAAPWHILAGLRNPGTAQHRGFFWFYFVNEHFLRFLGKRYPRDYNKLPATLYWALHLVWLFPWSLYLPAAVRAAAQEWRSQGSGISVQRGARWRQRFCCPDPVAVLDSRWSGADFFRHFDQPGVLHLPGIFAASAVAGRRHRAVRSDGV